MVYLEKKWRESLWDTIVGAAVYAMNRNGFLCVVCNSNKNSNLFSLSSVLASIQTERLAKYVYMLIRLPIRSHKIFTRFHRQKSASYEKTRWMARWFTLQVTAWMCMQSLKLNVAMQQSQFCAYAWSLTQHHGIIMFYI